MIAIIVQFIATTKCLSHTAAVITHNLHDAITQTITTPVIVDTEVVVIEAVVTEVIE